MSEGAVPRTAAVVIVGGGVMGASVAYHLAQRGVSDVLLLERAELFGQGATGKCAGGVRHQFGSEINVKLSIESLAMLDRFEEELGQPLAMHYCGYLFLLTRQQDVAAFRRNVEMQHRLGVMTEWLDAADVQARLPLLQLADVLAGTFYGRDGLTDPNSVVSGYVGAARRLGAKLLTGIEVVDVRSEGDRVKSVVTTRGEVETELVVNAAGPFAADLGRMLKVEIPIVPLRRQMLVTTPLPEVPVDFPFVVDFATGLYFHREVPGLLTGQANHDEEPGTDESVDLDWEQVHLAHAVERMPLLERAGLAHHWAGLYEVSPDAHPLIGRIEPFQNAYIVSGFSGHGFMHGPIAGKLLAEIILDGHPSTLDISVLNPSRFATTGSSVREYNVV